MKIGPHVIRTTQAALEWARGAPIVKQLDGVGALQVAPPDSIRVYRRYFPDQELSRLSPEMVVNAILNGLGGYRHPKLYVELLNETYQSRADRLAEYVAWTRVAARLLHAQGLKVCGFCFSTGQPELAEWYYLKEQNYAEVDAIGLHEYWGAQGFSTWNALRYRRVHEVAGVHPPFLITECGRDQVEGGGRGWRRSGISAEKYLAELLLYDSELKKDAYVLGAVVFTAGPTPDWEDFSTDVLDTSLLREGVDPIPDPGPAPAPAPGPGSGGAGLEERVARLEERSRLLIEAWKRFRMGKFDEPDGIDALIVEMTGGALGFTPVYPAPPASGPAAAIEGIDVSRWQGKIDWSEVAKTNIRVAIAKATEGIGYTDPQFKANWEGIAAVGLIRGAYHFGRPDLGNDARKEAEYFVKTVGELDRNDILVLDIEIGQGDLGAWVLAWLDEVEKRTGRVPWLYSGLWFMRPHKLLIQELAKYPLWLALYSSEPPRVPAPWTRLVGWQYTNRGRVAGIQGLVDRDLFWLPSSK